MYQSSDNALTIDRFNPADDFLYISDQQSLIAKGCLTRLTVPFHDGVHPTGHFQTALNQAFQEAKTKGVAHPVVVGAIPFDTSQPSALYVPQHVEFTSRQRFQFIPDSAASLTGNTTKYPDKETFKQMVSDAIEAMRSGQADKIVLSRLIYVNSDRRPDRQALFARLNRQNPSGYNFHVPLDDGSSLIGASPELLIRRHGLEFSSMPLAGSAKRADDPEKDQLAGQQLMASGKDRYEHQLVIHDMRRSLAPISQHVVIPDTPTLSQTPTLWHLATHINGIATPESNVFTLASVLHPTPALCGAPQTNAKHLIEAIEPFDRRLFGGIVGWGDEAGNGEWVIAIRCGRIQDNQLTLFAGAGIVPDSSPEMEWQETAVKLSTMQHVLGLNEE
jgi:isochorismate synthase